MTKSIIRLAIAVLLTAPLSLWGQVVVGGTIPDPSATLDVQSTSQGVLLPRLNATERDAIISPATSLVIFNTTSNCLEINLGTPAVSDWVRMRCRTGVVSMLDCSNVFVNGSLVVGTSVSGVSAYVPYTGGNGGVYDARVITSTGVAGLTATLNAGNLTYGSGKLTYSITGTPSSSGTASFALSIGGQTCSLDVTVLVPGSITTLDCGTASTTGPLVTGQSATGLSTSVPYTGGNGGYYGGQTVTSTGVTGLTATLSAGIFAVGSGSLSYAITGTPSSSGTASFALDMGGQTCTLNLTVFVPGSISAINCGGASTNGTLSLGLAASGVSTSVPYTGGNGSPHNGQTVTSTGVGGLTATLIAGSFSSGSGTLSYSVTGTPSSIGTASFALSIGGQSCNLAVTVSAPVCRAKVTSTDYKVFMCYNLGAANTSADPFTPSWEINGGYWQWGRAAEATTGPTGPGAGDANEGAITGWNTTNAADGSWTDASKTANDPCPSGFRVPTKAHWDGVKANNTLTNVGSNWTAGPTNYSTGKKIGGELMLPATGNRDFFTGSLGGRGSSGYYWSSTQSASTKGWDLDFETSNTNSDSNFRTNGFPVRCIAE